MVKDVLGRLSNLEHVVVSGANASGYLLFRDELAKESDRFETAATHPDEPAFWLYSSGSTGMPKGVRHLHSNLEATAETYAKKVLGIREDDVGLSAAKLFFAYGLGNALTFPLSVGATVLLMAERPTPDAVFRRWRGGVNETRPTVFYGAPTGFAGMLASPALPSRDEVALRPTPSPPRRGERVARFAPPLTLCRWHPIS